jgi:hypothetical protein
MRGEHACACAAPAGTKFRQMLRGGEDIPEWFAFKSVVKVCAGKNAYT